MHIPEGATPKDGPSAGITICTAIISALAQSQTHSDLALTGEITLQGRVLAVGGLKEKLLAAQQHKIKTLILPQENHDDMQDVLKEITLDNLELVYVNTMDQVLEKAFVSPPTQKKQSRHKKATKKQIQHTNRTKNNRLKK